MDIKIPIGAKTSLEMVATKENSACTIGSGRVNVFATPAMIAFMERAALESIEAYLPEGYTSVGTEVHIKHLKATSIGQKIKADSFLKSREGSKLKFELHAWDENGMIGIGTHTRVLVEERRFMKHL